MSNTKVTRNEYFSCAGGWTAVGEKVRPNGGVDASLKRE